jgi:CBS domain-containing protein
MLDKNDSELLEITIYKQDNKPLWRELQSGFVLHPFFISLFLYFQLMQSSAIHFSDQFYTKKISDLHVRRIRLALPRTPIEICAKQMAEEQVSCLFIGENGSQILGYITDLTLRDKVLAKGLSPQTPVNEILETDLVHITPNSSLVEALLLMFQTKARYLLVKNGENYLGWISRTKVLTEQSQGPFMFIQSVKEARHFSELAEKWNRMPELVHLLISRGMKAANINQIITTVADTITQRVIERVIKEKGPAPAKFVYFVLGSEGRGELTLKTDQDNAIIYEDKANEHREEVRTYFLDFASKVSTALDQIGIAFCEGELMAMNPKWTHSLSHWKKNYDSWISEATQENAMNYSTFFDCRAIFGDFSLLDQLTEHMGKLIEKAPERFYVSLGHNALQYEPPLTFFKRIKTEEIEGEKQLNLKKTMRPIVDLARVYALKHRIFETGTIQRIQLLESNGIFTRKEVQELTHAFEYLMSLRLENQALALLEKGNKAKNYLMVNKLTKVQQVTLIEIFKVIEEFQARIRISFTRTL